MFTSPAAGLFKIPAALCKICAADCRVLTMSICFQSASVEGVIPFSSLLYPNLCPSMSPAELANHHLPDHRTDGRLTCISRHIQGQQRSKAAMAEFSQCCTITMRLYQKAF